MIQFNLLPDIKLQYIKAKRTKRLVISVASLVSAVSVGLVIILLLAVFVFQRKHMQDLTGDIAKYKTNLGSTADIDKILTVQNQLNSLTALHQQKPDTTRILPFMEQLTPQDVSISSLVVDFDTQTMTITGSSKAANGTNKVAAVNKFVDTLKFTTFNQQGGDDTPAFSEVVLSSLGRGEKDASYNLTLKYDPLIVSNTETIKLKVPSRITTRSETEKPAALFDNPTANKEQ